MIILGSRQLNWDLSANPSGQAAAGKAGMLETARLRAQGSLHKAQWRRVFEADQRPKVRAGGRWPLPSGWEFALCCLHTFGTGFFLAWQRLLLALSYAPACFSVHALACFSSAQARPAPCWLLHVPPFLRWSHQPATPGHRAGLPPQ